MSSTNKTTNYNLSQYIGSDKPTYLSDYNGDMFKIDAQMKLNADNVATAIQGATDASTLANTANSTATTANANANTAISNSNATATALNNFMLKFNLSNVTTYTQNDVTITGTTFTSIGEFTIKLAKNSDGSIFKLYGTISASSTGAGLTTIELPNTGILTDSSYSIQPAGVVSFSSNDRNNGASLTVENNKITITFWNNGTGYLSTLLYPCVYFNADFGDEPINNN